MRLARRGINRRAGEEYRNGTPLWTSRPLADAVRLDVGPQEFLLRNTAITHMTLDGPRQCDCPTSAVEGAIYRLYS